MPQEWNGKIATTKEELIPRWFNSEHHLAVTLDRYKDKPYGIKRLQRAGNGRVLLIDFDSLDIEIRNALGDPRKVYKNNWLDKFYVKDSEALQFYSSFRFDDGGGLSQEHIEAYTVNASVLKACQLLKVARERERRTKRGSLLGIMKTIWSDAMHFQIVLEEKHGYQHSLPQNERRFCDAYKKFEKEGFSAMISKKHGIKNALKVTEDVIMLLNALFAGVSTKPTPTYVATQYTLFLAGKIEVVNNDTAEVYNPELFPSISDSTIQSYLGKWENKIGNWKLRSGDRQTYMNKFKPTHSTDGVEWAGSLLSIDDRNPPFKTLEGKRIWFYVAADVGSEAFVCWVHGKTKEGIIKDFYRQLVRNYDELNLNMSAELECESSLNMHLKDTILKEGVLFNHVRIEKNNSTGKKIETFFRQLRYGENYEKDLQGWLPRPTAKTEAYQIQKEEIRLPYEQIVKEVIGAMERWNNTEHPKYKGKTRWQVFMEKQHPTGTVPLHWDVLLPNVGYETKTSCNTGFVRLNKAEFCLGVNGKLALGEDLIGLMKKIEGQDITAYWLDDNEGNTGKVVAYYDGKYVCDLVPKPTYKRALIERTERCEQNYQLIASYVSTVTSFGARQSKAVEKVTVLDQKVFGKAIESKAKALPAIVENDDYVAPTTWQRKKFSDRF